MKKTEIPNYFWLARTPDDKLAVTTFWGLGPTFVIPDEKLSRLSKYYPGVYTLPFIIPIMFIWIYLTVNEMISVATVIISFLLVIFILRPCIVFLFVARYRRVNTDFCLRLSNRESYGVRIFATHSALHLMEFFNVAAWGVMFFFQLMLDSSSHFILVSFLNFILWTAQFVFGLIPLSNATIGKLMQMKKINEKIAVRVPEFKIFYQSPGVCQESNQANKQEPVNDGIPETRGGMLF